MGVFRLVQLHLKANSPLREVITHREVLQAAPAWIKYQDLQGKGEDAINNIQVMYKRSQTCENAYCMDQVTVRFPDDRLWPAARTLWIESPGANFAINGHFYP